MTCKYKKNKKNKIIGHEVYLWIQGASQAKRRMGLMARPTGIGLLAKGVNKIMHGGNETVLGQSVFGPSETHQAMVQLNM